MIGLDNIWGKPGMIFGFRKDTDGKETISTILHDLVRVKFVQQFHLN